MQVKNTKNGYGIVARFLHWGMAIAIFGLFGLGYWMRTLDYYSPYNKIAPHIHQSIGIFLFIFLVGRFIWRKTNVQPDDSYLPKHERLASHVMHLMFYAMLVTQMFFGYLISTVDGRSIDVFSLFTIPSVYEQKGLEDIVGVFHEYMAYAIITMAVMHAGAAIKHHIIDKDATLIKMWRGDSSQ